MSGRKKQAKRFRGSSSTSAQPDVEDDQIPAGWPKKKSLSELPADVRPQLFRRKLSGIIVEKCLKYSEFQGFMVKRCFASLGWRKLLFLEVYGYYERVIVEWMSTLTREGDTLTGYVDGRSYSITPELIRRHFGIDALRGQEYVRLNETNEPLFHEALRSVYGLDGDGLRNAQRYKRSQLGPLAKILWRIGVWNVFPRLSDQAIVRVREIFLLHALLTGAPKYSFALLVIDDLWTMFEKRGKGLIPHGFVISDLLLHLGAVGPDERLTEVHEPQRYITRASVTELVFTQTEDDCILLDTSTHAQLTFSKMASGEFEEFDSAADAPQTTTQMPHQPEPRVSPPRQAGQRAPPMGAGFDPEVLTARFQGMLMETVGRLPSDIAQLRHVVDRQSEMIDRQTEMISRQSEMFSQQSDLIARARLESQASIWATERYRYQYEQEQEQARQYYDSIRGLPPLPRDQYIPPDPSLSQSSSEVRFPPVQQISHYPPQPGSAFYDPDDNEGPPSTFQQLYHDLFGSRP